MVENQNTRAASNRLKATALQRGTTGSPHEPTEEESVTNTLIPGENVRNTTNEEEESSAPHDSPNPTGELAAGTENKTDFVELLEVVKPATGVAKPEPDEKTQILNHAIEAQAAGDNLLAGILFDALARLTNPNLHKTARTTAEAQASTTVPDGLEHDGDLMYATTVTTHNFVGFTPYLDKNIRKLRGPIPLTIFDEEWQHLAMKCHLGKRARLESSTAEKLVDYKGYGFFAALLLIHKKHCDDLIDEKGFMVAFWYNMQMRSNTFCHRIPVNGKSCIPDISQRKDHLIKHCYTVARNYGELKWKDNHYAPGHSHSSIDPITGQPKQNLHQIRNNNFDFNPTDNPVHVFQNQGPWMFQNQAGSFSQPFHQGPKNQNQHRDNQNGNALPGGEPRKRSKGGYKGSKFIDGYVDKRSSNTNGNNQNNAPSGSGSHR
ncbi:hypothetical protein MJO28_017454 [Puccinia striiformis f. sp. tritici]|uniref:Uncharacterized protein n=1 Tax=Puccinia striiformis TaxID=27350 RepID=A0A2S4V7H6_9BASI|nr:hypothetical protein MJO28_017454 [Puccinia striiformis f. sp. tritici]POW05447.1 hypothetical protein PSTT_09684 [Puccinia striiformis]